jgi:hypothetical protein
MYKFSIFLLCCLGFSVQAQHLQKLVPHVCVSSQELTTTLARYGENPALTMMSSRVMDQQQQVHSSVLFVNYDTKTWTLVEKVQEDLYCVSAMGNEIQPFRP